MSQLLQEISQNITVNDQANMLNFRNNKPVTQAEPGNSIGADL